MAVEFFDGFDNYSVANMGEYGWTAAGATGGPRFGTTGQSWNGFSNNSASYGLPLGSLATRIIGFALNIGGTANQAGNVTKVLRLNDGGDVTADVQLEFGIASGFLNVYRGVNGSGGTLLAQASTGPTMLGGLWYYVEVKATIGAAGAVQVNVSDGVASTTVINISGVNTQNTVNATFNRIWISGSNGTSVTCAYDDLYVVTPTGGVSTTFLGESRVQTIGMNTNGHSVQWTPLASTNVSQIDETLVDNDTSYNLSATVGQIDTFNPKNLGTTTPILAVQTVITARKDDVGARSISADIYDGSTDHINATAHGLLSSYTGFFDIYETDPSTSAQWTQAGFNARQFGYKMIS
jgi:hypothetical protein